MRSAVQAAGRGAQRQVHLPHLRVPRPRPEEAHGLLRRLQEPPHSQSQARFPSSPFALN